MYSSSSRKVSTEGDSAKELGEYASICGASDLGRELDVIWDCFITAWEVEVNSEQRLS
jgi:hypothetical protein